jgi:hypothetical protein
MRNGLGSGLLAAFWLAGSSALAQAPTADIPVSITVDAAKPVGELRPIWRFFGADEPNYATMKDGRKLLGHLGALAQGRLFPHPQPAEHRRRDARPEVGQHQCLYRGRPGAAGL